MKPARELFVGVTSYNSALFLGACLDSLIATTSGIDWRCVVLDNASVDDSVQLARARGVEVVIRRCTQAQALNRLLAMSDGRRTLLIHADVVFLARDWYARCERRLCGDVALVSPEDIGCGPLTRPFGRGQPESSFMLFDTARARRARRWVWRRRFRVPLPARELDFDGDHVTHRLPAALARSGSSLHLMRVHAAPREDRIWYSPPFVPRYWDAEVGRLRYGLGNFYSIDGAITHYHNWYDRIPKVVDPASTLSTEADGNGLPLAYISIATMRFLDDYRGGRLVLPDPAEPPAEPRCVSEQAPRFDLSYSEWADAARRARALPVCEPLQGCRGAAPAQDERPRGPARAETAIGLRLAVFAPSAYPLGGVADWLDYLLAGLAQRGVEPELCLVAGGGHDVDRYLARHPWPKARAVRNPTGSAEGRVRALMAAAEATAAQIVLAVNLHDVYEAVRRLRWRGGRDAPKLAMALHALQDDLIADIARNADVLDGVIATNRLSVALAAAALAAEDRVHYAPYGVPPVAVAARPPRAPSPLRLLYAGRIEQAQKRVLDLAPILAAARRGGLAVRLAIAGAGDAEASLRMALAEAGVADCVDWLGDLERAQLAAAYRAHDALLITSEWETGPIVAWEAMAHGLPVVSARYVGSGLEAALVDGDTALLFDVGDAAAAAACLHRLADPRLRAGLVAAGRRLVAERYTVEHSVDAWHRALQAVLAAAPRPRAPPRPAPIRGRLDRWLGVGPAEDLRRRLGIGFAHRTPGAAWPHSGSADLGQPQFLEAARRLDRGETARAQPQGGCMGLRRAP